MHPVDLPADSPVHEAPHLSIEFLSELGHALRSPINSILGFTEMLLSGKMGPPTAAHEEFLRDVLSSARELLRLVEDMAAMARLGAGRVSFVRQRTDLERLAAEVQELFREPLARKSLRVGMQVDPRARQASVDLNCFRHVLSSYLATALELTPQGGRLTIRLGPEGERHLRLELEHSGQGISPEALPELFTPFERVDGPRDPRFRGSGLRLALVRLMVEAQGGSVGVRGRPGQEIIFHALLPQGPVEAHPHEEVMDGR